MGTIYTRSVMVKAKEFYKRDYTDGYRRKCEFYLEAIQDALETENVPKIEYSVAKLDYFIRRQKEYLDKKQDNLFCERLGIDKKSK